MQSATILYCFNPEFDPSDEWEKTETMLTPQEAAIYQYASRIHADLNDIEMLRPVLERALQETADMLVARAIDEEDDYVLDCMGLLPVDPDYVNDLVHDEAPHALEFFGLTGLEPQDLWKWDAHEHKMPLTCQFETDFEPINPFDDEWDLVVTFPDPLEEENGSLCEDQAQDELMMLLEAAEGDYSAVYLYLENSEKYYDGDEDLEAMALRVAGALGLKDFKL